MPLVISGATSGSATLQSTDATTTTITLPSTSGTAALTSEIIGVGQTWQNVTASRALGTTYTNSTSKPIFIAVECGLSVGGSAFSITVNGVKMCRYYAQANSGGVTQWSIVPSGQTYLATNESGATLNNWLELR